MRRRLVEDRWKACGVTLQNWAGNIIFHPRRFLEPSSLPELQHAVASSSRCRILGTGHSFSPVAVTDGDLISLAKLPARIGIDPERSEVTVSPGIRYGELAAALHGRGFALANLGSLPHISVAGACSTGTHGSGDRNGCLASSVVGIEIVTADGELLRVSRQSHPASFDGHVVALGSLGVISALTLSVEPTFAVRQEVFDDLGFDHALDHLDELFSGGYSVSLFTSWSRPVFDQVWRKRRDRVFEGRQPAELDAAWFGARSADSPRHPVAGMPAEVCTEQMGVAGPWHERLPHFRLDFRPSVGDELQTEYLLDRSRSADALRSLQTICTLIAPALLVTEVRSVARDDLWLSPAFGRESIAIHFTWKPDALAVSPVIRRIEELLEPFGARPHWGKVFFFSPTHVAAHYPRFRDAADLARSYDPAGKFENDFTSTYIRGSSQLG